MGLRIGNSNTEDLLLVKLRQTDKRIGIFIAVSVFFLALWISAVTGYVHREVEPGWMWRFSPLGLLQGTEEATLLIENHRGFGDLLGYRLRWDYFLVFLKTLVLEAPFYWFALRSRGFWRFLTALLIGNLATHPIVFFVFPRVFTHFIVSLLISEFFAAAVEVIVVGALLSVAWRSALRRGVTYSSLRGTMPGFASSGAWVVLANLFSWQIGTMI